MAPVAQDNERIQYKRRHSDSVTVTGSNEEFLLTSRVTMADGRFLSAPEIQGGRPVCVIGSQVASNLFQHESPLGAKIMIDEGQFEVVGVLEKQGGLLDGGGIDNQAIVPLKQFLSSFWSRPDYEIQVKVRDLTQLEDAKEEVRAAMRRVRHLKPAEPDDFAINQQDQVVDLFHKIAGTIAAIGLFITGLSLFVGGIGIMNIMFVSVAERTREIGIRKAIGAKRRTILVQFLIEAATICLIGGLLGLGIAWPLTLLLKRFMPTVMSLTVVGIAIVVSLITGVLSGFFPAWRAARMNPVDALRSGE